MDFTFSDSTFSKNFLLGQELQKRGFISQEQLDEALIYQVRKNIRLGEALLDLGYVREKDLDQVIADQFGIEYFELKDKKIDEELVKLLPHGSIKKYALIPIKLEKETLTVCVSDPLDAKLVKYLQEHVDINVKLAIASRTEIEKKIEEFFYQS